MYNRMMYTLLRNLWWVWHVRLRDLYGINDGYFGKTRPWYHLCCNGDAGGWRTRLCDALENYDTGYRKYEENLTNT